MSTKKENRKLIQNSCFVIGKEYKIDILSARLVSIQSAARAAFICSFLEYEKFLKMKVDRKTNVRISWKEKEKYTCVWRFVLTFMPVYIQTYVYIYLYVRIFVCVFDHNLAVHETTHIFLVWILNVKNTHSYALKNESMV